MAFTFKQFNFGSAPNILPLLEGNRFQPTQFQRAGQLVWQLPSLQDPLRFKP